mmetsp:Transcript_17767/g.41955  ORF Transcript_17767/g.41955 Transcript_17767/m.41955 type:complete len:410 (+) Transcript_17767:114-1343(+)
MQLHRSVANCRLQLTAHGLSLLGGQTFNLGLNATIRPLTCRDGLGSKSLSAMRIKGMTYSNKLRFWLEIQILAGRTRNETGGKLAEIKGPGRLRDEHFPEHLDPVRTAHHAVDILDIKTRLVNNVRPLRKPRMNNAAEAVVAVRMSILKEASQDACRRTIRQPVDQFLDGTQRIELGIVQRRADWFLVETECKGDGLVLPGTWVGAGVNKKLDPLAFLEAPDQFDEPVVLRLHLLFHPLYRTQSGAGRLQPRSQMVQGVKPKLGVVADVADGDKKRGVYKSESAGGDESTSECAVAKGPLAPDDELVLDEAEKEKTEKLPVRQTTVRRRLAQHCVQIMQYTRRQIQTPSTIRRSPARHGYTRARAPTMMLTPTLTTRDHAAREHDEHSRALQSMYDRSSTIGTYIDLPF